MLRWIAIAVVLLASVENAFALEVGDRVVVIHYTELKIRDQTADPVWPGLILQVTAIEGNWLWVTNRHPGWIETKHVIPLDRAIPAFSDLVRRNPNVAGCYGARGAIWSATGELENAISDFNEAIRLNPIDEDRDNIQYYSGRGLAWERKGELEKAIADYDEAIRLASDVNAGLRINRGHAWMKKRDFERAMSDFNEAIRLDSKCTIAYVDRGTVWMQKQRFDLATNDFNEAIRLDQKYAPAYSQAAWLAAACVDRKYRNGKKAVEYASIACRITGWKDENTIESLAAAYAECGDFESAIEWQKKAIEISPEGKLTEFQGELELYKNKKSYTLTFDN